MTSVSSQSAQANLKTSGLNYTASGLYNTYHNYLLFWSAFIWQIFLERKSSAGCLPKKWLMKICIFRDTQVFSSNYNATWQKNCKSQLCAVLQWPKIADTQEILYLCVYSSDSWGWRMRSRSFNEPVTCFHEFCSNERLHTYYIAIFCRFFEYILTYLVEKQNEEYVFVNFFFRFVHKKFVKNMWWALPLTMMGFEEFWDSSIFLR